MNQNTSTLRQPLIVNSATKSRRQRRRWVLLLVLALLGTCWFSGLAGRLLAHVLLPRLLPIKIGQAVLLTSLEQTIGNREFTKGIVLTISPNRANRILHQAILWFRFLPPGLLRDKVALRGELQIDDSILPESATIPLNVQVDQKSGPHPTVSCRYPATEFNKLLERALAEGLRTREDYALGHYTLVYKLTFDTIHLYSDDRKLSVPARRRRFTLNAKGKVQLTAEENLFDIRMSGRVSDLIATVTVDFVRHMDGIAVDYNLKIHKLHINFNNVNELLDGWSSDRLRESLEKSLNKEKKKRKLAIKRLPDWTPLDVIIDLQVTE